MSDNPNTPREAVQDMMAEVADLMFRAQALVWQVNSAYYQQCARLTDHLAGVQRSALERNAFQRRHGQA